MSGKNKKVKQWHTGFQHWQFINIFLVIYDIIAIAFSYFFALWIRFDGQYSHISEMYLKAYVHYIPIHIAVCLIVFALMKMYRTIWRYASVDAATRVTAATLITGATHVVGITLLFCRMPISYYVGGIVAQYVLTLGIRFAYRFVNIVKSNRVKREDSNGSLEGEEASRIMIIGAGSGGQTILREIKKSSQINAVVKCFIDDNPNKWNRYLDDVPIAGGRETIQENVRKYNIDRIIFAIPTIDSQDKKEILNICSDTGCKLQMVPGIYQLVNEELSINTIKDVNVEDLLGRDPIVVDTQQILDDLSEQVILVTGGGGSIGSELCRQIASHNPRRLIIFDIYENNLYEIQQELKRNVPNLELEAIVGSVRDSKRLKQVFSLYRPNVVFHAAAHKHVPLMEASPWEAIKNNAIGTYKTAFAAMTHGTRKFVLISTDKAVNPTNIMGASKRLCEMIIQTFACKISSGKAEDLKELKIHEEGDDLFSGEHQYANTKFAAVRFGNVLGSNGSVIPLFRKQIEAGGPVTVTHPNITRFFMTIPEAVSLVLQASAYARSGEIFVLDMGEPVKIDTLARKLIRLSGFTPDVDMKIQYVGLRPGEKMYEEKLMDEEGMTMTPNKLIYIGHPLEFDENKFINDLSVLMKAAYDQDPDIKRMVADVVNTYTPE
ncbi:MAG: polysaccharide biosynthesis protein [Lachnospiraceae bacterium]|nr:polysaccharide biosynthesis protein [Lachnospiraceae bacterium]